MLNQLCCNFFWKGNSNAGRGAKVRWQDVCLPKVERGLRLKDILSWNRACMIQHIWQIFAKAETIWIAWIYAYMFKGEYMAGLNYTKQKLELEENTPTSKFG